MTDIPAPDFIRRTPPRFLGSAPPLPVTLTRRAIVHPALRRRTLVRRAVVATVALSVLTIGMSDVRGRVEVGQIDHAQGNATDYLTNLGVNLTFTRANVADQQDRVRYFQVQLTEHHAMVDSTNSQTQTQEIGIFYDSINLSALNGCLGGVTQALDQIGVGQTFGGLVSLNAVGPICQSASP